MDKESLLGQLEPIWKFFTTPIFSLNNNAISIASFIAAFVIFVFFIIISKWVENLVAKALEKRTIDPGVKGSLERFSRYLTIAIGGFITLDSLGISLNSLAALGAILMVGIGFGLQNIAQNSRTADKMTPHGIDLESWHLPSFGFNRGDKSL